MNQVTIRFATHRLLWRTRGASWDYWFALRPTIATTLDWSDAFERVFPDSQAPRTGTEYRRGQLTGSKRSAFAFHAAALTDPTRKDAAGRQVQHFFLYLEAAEPGLDQTDWGSGLLAGLAPAYDAIFALAPQSGEGDQAFPERLQRTFGDHLPREITVLAEPVARPRYIDMGVIAMPEPSPPTPAVGRPEMASDAVTGAVPRDGMFGLPGLKLASALGRLLGAPAGYKNKIADLVARMAEEEGPEATRRFLAQLDRELALKR